MATFSRLLFSFPITPPTTLRSHSEGEFGSDHEQSSPFMRASMGAGGRGGGPVGSVAVGRRSRLSFQCEEVLGGGLKERVSGKKKKKKKHSTDTLTHTLQTTQRHVM